MVNYYTALASRSHAFLLERRMNMEGVECELAIMPREVMNDLCNLGVKFGENVLPRALDVIRRSGLPGCKVYKEEVRPGESLYYEVIY